MLENVILQSVTCDRAICGRVTCDVLHQNNNKEICLKYCSSSFNKQFALEWPI